MRRTKPILDVVDAMINNGVTRDRKFAEYLIEATCKAIGDAVSTNKKAITIPEFGVFTIIPNQKKDGKVIRFTASPSLNNKLNPKPKSNE